MTEPLFSVDYIKSATDKCLDQFEFVEKLTNDGPYRALVRADDPQKSAGSLRLWRAPDDSRLDRMILFRLQSTPVETHLFFVYGRSDNAMPHFHGQIVQFSPDGCVYNADLIPRLDPVEHPDYFRQVFHPLSKPYWRATKNKENVCANAPANPAIAAFLSPWSIGTGSPTNRAEFDRVRPQLDAYLDHFLTLAADFDYSAATPDALRQRDAAHLEAFMSDRLDPRAWKGVYGVVGEEVGQEIKTILKTPLK